MYCEEGSIEKECLINSISIDTEYERNPKLCNADVGAIRKWLHEQSHLPQIQSCDIALFLHSNDYDLNKTKINIENYFTMRSFLPEFFIFRDAINSQELRRIFDIVSVVSLEELTEQGHRVIYTKLIDIDAKKYVYNDAVKYFNMVVDLCIYKDGTNPGYAYVFDLSGATQEHLRKLTFMGLKKFLDFTSKGMPIKWEGLHYIAGESSSSDDGIQDFVKSNIVLNSFAEKLHFHADKRSLNQYVPLNILPTDIGGSAGYLKSLHSETVTKLEKHRDWFLKVEELTKVDEKKREGKPKISSDIFGSADNFNF